MSSGYQVYNQHGTYYLTFQVVRWIDVFSRQVYRDTLVESLKFCVTNKGLSVHAYVIMSNHVHLILSSKTGKLSDTIRDFKGYTSKQIYKALQVDTESRKDWILWLMREQAQEHKRNDTFQLWTHENHAVELISPKFTQQKLDYIHENPVRAGLVDYPEAWRYSSARNYAGRIDALMEVELL